jgi:23S rRNA (cytosine1962-C5)-methyltransferase
LESLLPIPEVAKTRVILKPGKSRPFFGRHPWVLETAIQRVETPAADGDVVDLFSDRGKFIGRGIYNSHSRIRVRLYAWSADEPLDEPFWRRRIETAIALREALGYQNPAGATRLIYSEADSLGGLILERYGEHLILQVTALAMSVRLPVVMPTLVELLKPRSITVRMDRETIKAEGVPFDDRLGWGELPEGPVFVEEHGIRYGVDLRAGQKTGFYLDQRENRKAAAKYLGGKRVLDMCCYSGGFSLAASILGGAKQVLGIDSSQKAIALAQGHAQLNGVANVHFEVDDCFERLNRMLSDGERYDAIILDPPKFAGSRQAVADALRAYHHLNKLAVHLLNPQGILVTCSCSGRVSREDFLYMLADVAQRSKREIQILEQHGAAPDHPVTATCLETEYLKCFICRVV